MNCWLSFFLRWKVWPCPGHGAWVAPKIGDLQVIASLPFLHVAAEHPSLYSGERYFLSGPDQAAVPEERISEIYTRNLADQAKPTGQLDERSRYRTMAIQAYRETCPSDHITGCCDVCDCCAFSQAFVEKFDELVNGKQ